MPFAGFEMPVRYSSDLDEHNTVRNAVGIFDVSHMGEFVVKGDDALALIQRVSANDAAALLRWQSAVQLPTQRSGRHCG